MACVCDVERGFVCQWHELLDPASAHAAAEARELAAALARRRPPFGYHGVDRYGRDQRGAVVVMGSADLVCLLRIKKKAGWRECVVHEYGRPGELVGELVNANGREFTPVLYGRVASR